MTCWLCHGGLETNAEELMCKNGPCQSCVDVEKVNQEINQTITILQQLVSKRRNLRSEQNRAHDPMHQLPLELKNYIFQLTQPPHDEWGETAMPSYLASVCREWHNIALSTPLLWSTMSVRLGNSTLADPPSLVHDWILRSHALPLTFHFQVLDDSKEGLARSKKVLGDVMSQYSDRFQSLSVSTPSATNAIHGFQNDSQWHRLTQLRIIHRGCRQDQLSIFNATASPEKIALTYISFKSLQISWNRLSFARMEWIGMDDIVLLLQHAPQLTHCHIVRMGTCFSAPSIIHHRLETLSLHSSLGGSITTFFGSLTLPCLQEFNTDEMVLLAHLPALVDRSSCPLTRLALFHDVDARMVDLDRLQPLPGVVDLVVSGIADKHQHALIKLLLKQYFPDLRQLTLRLKPFLRLWNMGHIPMYLDRKRPRPDGPSEGRLHKFLVVDPGEAVGFKKMWNSDVGEQVKALGISLREDGFEFL